MRSRRVRKIPCARGRASVDSSYSFLATAFFFLPVPFFPGLLPAFPGVRLRLFPFFFLPGIPGPCTWSMSTARICSLGEYRPEFSRSVGTHRQSAQAVR